MHGERHLVGSEKIAFFEQLESAWIFGESFGSDTTPCWLV